MNDMVAWTPGARSLSRADDQLRRPIVVVLGPARSGLSLCVRTLAMLGIAIAEPLAPTDAERTRDPLFDLQDDVLALFDRGQDSPLQDYPMPPAWWVDARVRPVADRMRDALAARVATPGLGGLSDTRMPRLMPLWMRLFADLGLAPRFVVCLRDPALVARSQQARDGLGAETAELRVLDAAVDCLRYTREHARLLLLHADWSPDPFVNATALRAFAGAEDLIQANDFDVALQALVEPRDAARDRPATIARQPLVRHFFHLAYTLATDEQAGPAALDRIRAFTDNYIAFRQLLGPFEASHRAALAGLRAGPASRPGPTPEDQAARAATLAQERDAARAALVAAEDKVARAAQIAAESQTAYARLEQAAIGAEGARLASEGALQSALALQAEMAASQQRLELKLAQGDAARGRLSDALEAARAAQAEAEAVGARLEGRLHEHSVALSDTLASLARAEAAQRAAEGQLRAAPGHRAEQVVETSAQAQPVATKASRRRWRFSA